MLDDLRFERLERCRRGVLSEVDLDHGSARLAFGRRLGCGRHFHGGPHGFRGFRGGPGQSFWLRRLFSRLDTTPGQEKVIKAALEDLWKAKGELREELKQARSDVARAVRGEIVDEATLDEAYARQDRLLATLRVSVTHAIKIIHEALDERQRKLVADMLEQGPFGGGRGPWGGGPYRSANA